MNPAVYYSGQFFAFFCDIRISRNIGGRYGHGEDFVHLGQSKSSNRRSKYDQTPKKDFLKISQMVFLQNS